MGDILKRRDSHLVISSMDKAIRLFTRKIVMVHAIAFLIVVAAVIFASRELYFHARAQALEQAAHQQQLVAHQTATGIENFYNSISDNLDLLHKAEEAIDEARIASTQPASEPTTAPHNSLERPIVRRVQRNNMALPPLPPVPSDTGAGRIVPYILYWQIQDRVSYLLTIDNEPSDMRILRILPEQPRVAEDVKDAASQWLREVGLLGRPAISTVMNIGGQDANLICVPTSLHRLFVAVVPVDKLHEHFLNEVNRQKAMSAILLDDSSTVMAAMNTRLLGFRFDPSSKEASVKKLANDYIAAGKAGTEIFETPPTIGGVTLAPALTSIEPINLVNGNQTWNVVISSSLSNLDTALNSLFRRTFYWALFVVVSMTTILLSTAIQLIRGRVKIERERHRIIARELDQARRIQLAWLPEHYKSDGVDIAAINQPANHISGDFYDWFDLADGRTVVTIGDVTGHGMSAAFLMATTQLLIRNTMLRVKDPGRCLEDVNRQLCTQVFHGQFVTVVIMVLDREANVVSVANAGHFPPILASANGAKPLPVDSQLVLGVDRNERYPTVRIHLPTESSLLLFTDGVIDAQDAYGTAFGTKRLVNQCALDAQSAEEILNTAVTALNRYRGQVELIDDLTLVAVQWQPITAPKGELATASNMI